MKRNLLLNFTIFCVLALQGCNVLPSESSQFLSNQCKPPCWGGITPGKSTIFDAYNNLVLLENIDPRTFYFKDRRQDGGISLQWDFTTSEYGIVYQDNGTVSEIVFQCMNNLTLSEVIDTLGDPSNYLTGYFSGGDSIVYRVLVVSDQGYIAGMTLNNNEEVLAKRNGVPTDHKIDVLIYFRKDSEEIALRRYMMNTFFDKMERFPWKEGE